MQKTFFACLFFLSATSLTAQNRMTPELLWQLGRVAPVGISKDGNYVVYSVGTPNVAENKTARKTFMVPIGGGEAVVTDKGDSLVADKNLSPDGRWSLSNKDVKIKKITGKDYYPELTKVERIYFR